MDPFMYFLVTVFIAAAGGLIGYKLKLPAGAMLGAMVATVAFNLITENGVFYSQIRVGIQILAGAMVGSRMDMQEVKGMRKLIMPIIILVIGMFVINVLLGTAMYMFSNLDAATSLFAVAPGGASDMAIIAADLGANPAYIAILQLCRIIIIFTCMPPIMKKLIGKIQARDAAQAAETLEVPQSVDAQETLAPELPQAAAASVPVPAAGGDLPLELGAAPEAKRFKIPEKYQKLGMLILFSAVVGMIFYFLGITAGAMIGGMVGGTIYGVWKGKVPFPPKIKVVMQIGSGAFIGMRVEREILMSMGELVVPIIIIFIGIFAFSFVNAILVHKLTKLNLVTCMLASTPGGRQEMALMSEDLGADTASVAIMQTVRMMSVIAFFPTMLKFITGILNLLG